MSQRWMEFILEITAPNRFTSRSCTSWISSLDHESFDDTMENMPVIIAIFAVHTEVFHRFWTFSGKQFQVNISTCRVYCGGIVELLESS